ncbi:hypothetical protein [Streptomyces sp. KL116D]|uniref:hypothetical protein n=1 Tax=Streptomyces sp. KL116D TaxID=3045152 RepID=UPI003556D5BE
MKDDLLNLLTVWTALGETLVWLWILAPLVVIAAIAWIAISLGSQAIGRARESFARANQLIAEIQNDQPPHDPEAAAGYARLAAAIREEQP